MRAARIVLYLFGIPMKALAKISSIDSGVAKDMQAFARQKTVNEQVSAAEAGAGFVF